MHRFNCKLVDFTLFARPLGYTVASTCNIVKYTWLLLFVLFFSQVSSQARHPSHQLSSRSSPSHQRLHGHQQDHRHFLHRQHGPGSPLASYSPFPPPSRDPFLQHHFSLLPASSPYRQSPLSRPPLPPPPPPPHHTGHSHPSLQHQYPHPLHGGYSGAPPRTPSYSPSYGPSYHSDPSPDAAVSPASVPSIVRHPGTCTFQRSQPACTFSLLCYLAGGLPVEGCENNIGLTCCMLNSQSKGAFNVNPQSHLLAPPSVGHHVTRETGLEPSSPAPPSPPPPAPQPITPTAGPSSLAPLNNGFHSTPSGDNVLPHVAGREHHQTLLSPEKQAGSGNSAGELNNGGGSGSGSSHFSPLAGAGGSSYQPSNHLTSGQSPYLTSSYQEFPAYPPNSQSPVSSAYSYDSFAYGLDHHSKSKQEPGSQFSPTVASVKSYHTIGETSSPPLQSSAVKMSSFAGASHAPAAATPGAASFSSHSLSLSGSPGSSALAVSSHQSQVPPSTAVAPAGVHALPSDLTSSSHSSTTQALASPSLVPPSTSSLSLSSSLSVQSPVSSTPHSLSLSSTGSPILFSSSFDESPVTDNAVRRTIPGNSIDVNDLTDSDLSSPARPTRPEDEICGRATMKPRSRIIGGQDAQFGEFPWQVHIKIAKHQCGGALVNRDYVVTAAHCVYQAPLHQLSIIIGAHDIEDPRFQYEQPQYFSVAEVKLHPEFRFSASHPDRFDVAVLKLDKPAKYSSNIIPVCLPPGDISLEGWYGVVTGWGKTDPGLSNRYGTRLLQKVDVPIIRNHDCESWHHAQGIDLKIFPEMFCAGYEHGRKDACVGDSGGPLVVNLNDRWTLAGITSAGFGCAQTRQPGIYHRVPVTVDWVRQNILP